MKKYNFKSCKTASTLMSRSMDRTLSVPEFLTLKTHLMMCDACVFAFRQLRALKKVYRNYTKAALEFPSQAARLSDKARERIKAMLKN